MADCLSDHDLCKNFKNACQAQESVNLQLPEEQPRVDLTEDDDDQLVSGSELGQLRPEESRSLLEEDPPLSEKVIEEGQQETEDQILSMQVGEKDHHSQDQLEEKRNENRILKKSQVKKKRKVNKKEEAALKCPWTQNHASKASLKKDNTIRNLSVVDEYGIPAAGLQVITRRSYQDILINSKENVEEKADKKLLELTRDISNRLNKEVFSKEGEAVIGHARIILDLPKLAIKVKTEKSAVKVALTEFEKWSEAVKKVPIEDLTDVPQDELKSQFKKDVKRLEVLTSKYSIDELQELDSKILIKKFFDPDSNMFVDIEMILQAIAVASVKHSCESVLESFVSEYENHFDERRNVDENTANEEFEIAVNGPNLAHADSVIMEAMDLYWGGKP